MIKMNYTINIFGNKRTRLFDEIVWLICLLANQSVSIWNLWHPEEKKELLTTPYDLAEYKDAIMAAMYKGAKRYVQSEDSDTKNTTAG